MEFNLLDKQNIIEVFIFPKEVFDFIQIRHPYSMLIDDPTIGHMYKDYKDLCINFFICKN